MSKRTGDLWWVAITLVWLAALSVGGCNNIEGDWTAARQLDTRAAYSQFLEQYPAGEYSDEASQAIEALDWGVATTEGTLAAFEAYLRDYPNGRYASEAESGIVAVVEGDWTAARQLDTRAAYSQFLEQYPAGEYSDEASQAIEALDWGVATTEGTLAAFEAYLRDYPNGRYASEVESGINALHEYRAMDPSEISCSISDFNYRGTVAAGGGIEPTGGHIGSFQCRLASQSTRKAVPLARDEFADGGIVTEQFGVFKVLFCQSLMGGSSLSIMLTGIQKAQLKAFLR